MKQSITKEQWNEIESIAMDKFLEEIKSPMNTGYIAMSEKGYPTIGQMIEFLGNDWLEVIIDFNDFNMELIGIDNGKLCDALWEAVKLKLNK